MKITVPTTADTLDNLLSQQDLDRIYNAVTDWYALWQASYDVSIQNLGAQDIYTSELGEVATTTAWIKVSQNSWTTSRNIKRLSDLSLVANGSQNTNVRINVHVNRFLQ